MTSSLVSDIYLPLKKNMIENQQKGELKRTFLGCFDGYCFDSICSNRCYYAGAGGQSLVDFALGVMSFSYAGMWRFSLCSA